MRVKWLKVALTIAFSFAAMRMWAQAPAGQSTRPVYPPESVWPNPRLPLAPLTPSQREDQELSEQTKLSVKDVHKLRVAAGITDGDPSKRVVLIDGKTLGQRQIFLTIYSRDALCLTAEVIAHQGKEFQQMWSLAEMPGGPALCQIANCPAPSAAASKPDEVVITIRARRDGAPYDVCDDNILLTYRHAGSSFALASQQRVPATSPCTVDSQLSSASFYSADSADRLVWIQVIRSFGPPSYVAFQNTPDGPVAEHFSVSKEVWNRSNASSSVPQNTPSECIESAKSAPLERTRLPLTADQVQGLLNSLAKIDMKMDECPRVASGGCA